MLQFFSNKSLSLNWKTTGGNNANLHLNIITYSVFFLETTRGTNFWIRIKQVRLLKKIDLM